jgi:hypothetical protein
MRITAAQDISLSANALNRKIYTDEPALQDIRQIADDYFSIKGKWPLFPLRAERAIADCKSVLQQLVTGTMKAEFDSSFKLGADTLDKYVKGSVKAISVARPEYWQKGRSDRYQEANKNAIDRNVKITRVFVYDRVTLREIKDVLEKQKAMGVEVHVGFVDEVPVELSPKVSKMPSQYRKDIVVFDDCVAGIYELTPEGDYREQQITIDPAEVGRIVEMFKQVLQHAPALDDKIIGCL